MDYEKKLFTGLKKEFPELKLEKLQDSRWGRLIHAKTENEEINSKDAFKVLCIGSWTLGLLTLESLISLENEYPGKIRIIALVTDDPLDPGAKISLKRRFWRYYSIDNREDFEWVIVHRALKLNIPCYTGDVKCEGFHNILKDWNPDAIVTAGFGQIIDKTVIEFPPYGIYNVHPADLKQGYGAGPQPWEDMIGRKAKTTRLTIHKVSPEIDSGDVVGQSPPINIPFSKFLFN